MRALRRILSRQAPVTLFTTPGCPDCAAVKRFLEERGVSYRERDMSTDPRAEADMKRLAGVRIAPVTIVGGQAFYGTFAQQLPKLREALASRGPTDSAHEAPSEGRNP